MKAFQNASILFLSLVLANVSSIRIAYSEEPPAIEWQKTFLGSVYHEYGEYVRQTTDGGYIIAGDTTSSGSTA